MTDATTPQLRVGDMVTVRTADHTPRRGIVRMLDPRSHLTVLVAWSAGPLQWHDAQAFDRAVHSRPQR